MRLTLPSVPVGLMVRGTLKPLQDPFAAFKSLRAGLALYIAGAILHYGHAGHPNGKLFGCPHSLLACLMVHNLAVVLKSYDAADRQIQQGDILLFDMGCEYYGWVISHAVGPTTYLG